MKKFISAIIICLFLPLTCGVMAEHEIDSIEIA